MTQKITNSIDITVEGFDEYEDYFKINNFELLKKFKNLKKFKVFK